jgi:hypothetical protein
LCWRLCEDGHDEACQEYRPCEERWHHGHWSHREGLRVGGTKSMTAFRIQVS